MIVMVMMTAFHNLGADVNGCHVLMLRWCYNHHIIKIIRMSINVIVIHTFQSYFLFWRCFKGPRAMWIHMDTEAAEQSKFSVATTCLLCGVSQAFGDSHSGMRLAEWISDCQKKGPFWTASQEITLRSLVFLTGEKRTRISSWPKSRNPTHKNLQFQQTFWGSNNSSNNNNMILSRKPLSSREMS